jgi:hypothetical protein
MGFPGQFYRFAKASLPIDFGHGKTPFVNC